MQEHHFSDALPPPITGIIRDAEGNPLPGVNIVVKGTKRGVTTDANGKFSIEMGMNQTLVISSVGFNSREIRLDNFNAPLIVVLEKSVSELDEVVINKGYYTEKEKYTVGNVGKVTAKDIEKQPVNNPLLALQGRVPGLFIEQSTGLPGTGVTVLIQGQNSILYGNDPLYVIDGVPYISQLLQTNLSGILGLSGSPSSRTSNTGNPLSFINPADIESIEILKDADATAIYGSRAGNGAILITTKKGKAGQTRFGFNVQQGWGNMTRRMDMMNTPQYLEMRREGKKNDNAAIYPFDYDINGFWDTTQYTDWQKVLLGGTAQYSDVQVQTSGGSVTTNFLLGGGFHRETVVFPGDFADKKGSLTFNLNHLSLKEKFRLQLSGNYLVDHNQLPNIDFTAMAVGQALPPNAPSLYNSDGSLNWAPNSTGSTTWLITGNPVANLYKKYTSRANNLISNLVLSYKLLRGLELKSSFGYTNLQTNETTLTPLTSYDPSR
ncbi:MAG: TonB-dependent receptor plug domain-containing protein, partial [Chitinophagaceae bacterium]|nr:TonB-dependent receptor plug domain-containing protein [Chitinophagaceae bacterium]